MMKSFVALVCVLIAIRSVVAQFEGCRHPKQESKCEKKNCIPRIGGTTIGWNEVTPTSFVARWKPEYTAKCYYIQLLSAYTVNVMRTVECYEGTIYAFNDLEPSMIYGVQVSAVNFDCRRGRPGIPARTRTLWAPTTKPTTKPFVTRTPEPGACGRRFFTCHSNSSECIRSGKWCNRRINCKDGSDERGCPGGCEEIDVEFKSGNYSCSRWGSPGSVCLFDCKVPHVRDGSRYTFCSSKMKKWMNAVPTCRLNRAQLFEVKGEETTATTVSVEWQAIAGATRYTVLAIEKTAPGDEEIALVRTVSVDESECCKATIPDLTPETEFQITLSAVDENDVNGLKSTALFATTNAKAEAVIEFPEEPQEEE